MGDGANQYAVKNTVGNIVLMNGNGASLVSPLITVRSKSTWESHTRRLLETTSGDEKDYCCEPFAKRQKTSIDCEEGTLGTVGCICIDSRNYISSGTSSGGTSLKQYGRVGQVRYN